jgi:hypothetical protein
MGADPQCGNGGLGRNRSPALATGRRVLALGMAGSCPLSTSPQCQPTTDTKEKDLDHFEHTLYTSHTCFTGKNHRYELQVVYFASCAVVDPERLCVQ